MDIELFLNIFIVFCFFVIGTLFGSFFTLATYRIPRKEDIVKSRSYCPKCKHRLGFFDLIPVISYITHLGRCKYCKQKISPRYILIELFNGVAFVLMYFLLGYTVKLLALVIVYVAIFLTIGSNIMQNKMTPEEIEKVKSKNAKLNLKKGVFLVELLAALILFIAVMAVSYSSIRNYEGKSKESVAASNAMYLGIKALEVAKAADYKDLISYTYNKQIDTVDYVVDVTVVKDSDEDFAKKDLLAKVYVTVSYVLEDETKNLELKTLKVNDNI